MSCLEKYTKKCFDDAKRNLIYNKIQGFKNFHNVLCNNMKFEKEYLTNQECIQVVQRDWLKCVKNFKDILKNELAIVTNGTFHDNLMQFCCARLAFEECVFSSARYKCNPAAARFMRKLAKILSFERQFNNCDNMETVCSNALQIGSDLLVVLVFVFACKIIVLI